MKVRAIAPDIDTCSLLVGVEEADFSWLRQKTGSTDGNLGAQMLKLEEAGYVAMERVIGTLEGRTGTFALQHSGTMTRGAQQLSVTVVPDSGTGELTGLSGTLTITRSSIMTTSCVCDTSLVRRVISAPVSSWSRLPNDSD